jgi:hypothetical protein
VYVYVWLTRPPARQSVGKIEEELKQLGTRYTEKKQQLLQIQRKKGCGLESSVSLGL